jgi:hypothetical protein
MIQFKLNKQIIKFILVGLSIFMVFKISHNYIFNKDFFQTNQKTNPLIYSIVLHNTEKITDGFSFVLDPNDWDKIFGSDASDTVKALGSMPVKVDVKDKNSESVSLGSPIGLDVESITINGKLMIKATRSNQTREWQNGDIITKYSEVLVI